jgi:polyvinyl alcohol dehydrogenase (cytochrome)
MRSKNVVNWFRSSRLGLSALLMVGGLSQLNEAVYAEDILLKGYELYENNCASCHSGGVREAPLKASLKRLTVNHIFTSIDKGIMSGQAGHLTKDERASIASFLGVKPVVAKSDSYFCEDTSDVSRQKGAVNTRTWGFGLSSERMLSDTLIDEENVGALTLDWIFAFPNVTRVRSQPTVVGRTIYIGSADASIKALDLERGCLEWEFPIEAEVRHAISADVDDQGNATHLYFGDLDGNIYGFDIASQQLLWKREADAHPAATMTGSMVLHGARLFVPVSSLEIILAVKPEYECCVFRGSIIAVDKKTGNTIWQTFTTAKPEPQGQNISGTKKYGPSGAPIWSSPTIDTKRGFLYVGTGENYSNPASDTSDAIMAMSLETGAIQWVNQVTTGDAWNASCGRGGGANCPENPGPDFDFGAPPILTVGQDGKDIILAGQKSGRVYAFDPDNGGEMLWQKQVGRGGIMGGVHWGMATDRERLYVPISDVTVYKRDAHKPAKSGLHAVDIVTGDPLWSTLTEDNCGDEKWNCSPGLSAAATVVPGVVFAGGLDGMLRAFAVDTGAVLWKFNTRRHFGTVNGIEAFGGSFDSDGPVIVGDRLLVTSGYDKWGLAPGNVLLSFKLNPSSLPASKEK